MNTANDLDHRRRTSDAQNETGALTRRSVHPLVRSPFKQHNAVPASSSIAEVGSGIGVTVILNDVKFTGLYTAQSQIPACADAV